MSLVRRILLVCIMMIGVAPVAAAHEVNPAYLEITETEPGLHQVVWKQPLKDGRRLRLIPVFPDGCEPGPVRMEGATGAVIERWSISCDLSAGTIQIDGLQRTLTDVFVRLKRLDAGDQSVVLRPSAASFSLEASSRGAPLFSYFKIGVEHIIFGYDHLWFVLGLCLIVRARQLLLTVTAFTIAHSITLALSTLAGVTLPGPPVEAVIALSIVLLAREALSLSDGHETLTTRYPWAIAFGFGLIHGFGFAGALSDIGLPADQELWALLLFNLGVEVGQGVFVIAVFSVAVLLWRVLRESEQLTRTLTAYAIGVAGTVWLFERVAGFSTGLG